MRDHKIYVQWPAAMDLADKLDKEGFTSLARDIRGAIWKEAVRLHMLQKTNTNMIEPGIIYEDVVKEVKPNIKPLYIYLGPEPGYGSIMDQKPKLNQYHWYELGAALSDDPKDQHNTLINKESINTQPLTHNPRRQRE